MSGQTPSMSDIAKKAGVSKNTVSLALRNDSRLPSATRSRIQKLAARMGYSKNPVVAHLMVQLRAQRTPRSKPILALVNANLDAKAFQRHPTIPAYVEGCYKRAKELGYLLNEFWLQDPDLEGNRFNRILRSRNIPGMIVIGLMNESRLPSRFQSTWKTFPTVVTGVRTQDPALSFACTDHHMLSLKAVQQAWLLGYRRPTIVLDLKIERLVDGRFTSGFLTALQQLKSKAKLSSFYRVEAARKNPELFADWIEKEKPDVILTLHTVVREWLEGMGKKIPRDIGLIQLDRRRDNSQWSGMDQHNDVVGAAAVEMLIGMIHNNETGIPAFPRATLIGSTWIEGKTTLDSRI
jgi:DNA-binding LacI/PurR family transcriptional regulator